MTAASCIGVVVFAALPALQVVLAAPVDPFWFFGPSVALDAGERQRIEHGEAVAEVVPASGRTLAIFGAVRLGVGGDRLVAWVRDIAALKRSAFVLEIGRFSDPPGLNDLAGLTLDDDDLREFWNCRPGHCGLKLSVEEIAHIRGELANRLRPRQLAAFQRAFHEVILRRVDVYLAQGRRGPAPPPFLNAHWPELAIALERFPDGRRSDAESFLYWSKEQFGGKPVISVTHVTMVRGGEGGRPEALVVGRQVLATHYLDGAWSVTAVVRGEAGARYLAYLNQSEVDVLGGVFGGVVRFVAARRLKAEAVEVLQGLRQRLEGGEPPRRTGAGSRP